MVLAGIVRRANSLAKEHATGLCGVLESRALLLHAESEPPLGEHQSLLLDVPLRRRLPARHTHEIERGPGVHTIQSDQVGSRRQRSIK